ncbi:MAG TPA: NADH-quinone oxidoreductase subunit J [Candidatus Kapabacteria bacterium]|jgi:NADH-quinone oxidoreductase subunit J|nr:NADH-quinone oxidoreductase subunit J [Candidatus Kapabacteria bacterium]
MTLELVLFILLAVMAVGAALVLITARNPISSAMAMVTHFLALAGLYLTLHAQFMAAIQVLVYAGAIMVLVVFVIMLLNLGNEDSLRERFSSREGLGILASLFIGGAVIYAVMQSVFAGRPVDERLTNSGTIDAIGKALFTDYVFPFEMVSLVLLAAVVGAVVLTKRHLE